MGRGMGRFLEIIRPVSILSLCVTFLFVLLMFFSNVGVGSMLVRAALLFLLWFLIFCFSFLLLTSDEEMYKKMGEQILHISPFVKGQKKGQNVDLKVGDDDEMGNEEKKKDLDFSGVAVSTRSKVMKDDEKIKEKMRSIESETIAKVVKTMINKDEK